MVLKNVRKIYKWQEYYCRENAQIQKRSSVTNLPGGLLNKKVPQRPAKKWN